MRKPFAATGAALLLGALFTGPASAAVNDPFISLQWGLTRIEAEAAWPVADGTGTTIVVVDSGVDLDHPDLASKIVAHADANFTGDSDPDGALQSADDLGPPGRDPLSGYGRVNAYAAVTSC